MKINASFVLCFIMFLCANNLFALTYVVDNNADTDDLAAYTVSDGTNTLRKCIRLANANAGSDIINFNLPGSTVITNSIGGGGAWFTITSPLTIDGYTQSGALAGTPVVELDGAANGRWFTFSLEGGADASDISGLIIYGTAVGIRVSGSDGHTFSGNFIGVNATGTAEAANPITEIGIRLESSSNNTIGGTGGLIDRNIISECDQRGISIQGTSSDNVIYGNIIGLDKAGTSDIGNTQNGIWAENCSDLIIGGATVNHQNIISGNDWGGIYLTNSPDPVIKGNVIGLGADTSTALGNSGHGIELYNGSHRPIIGGDGEGNFISSNTNHGINLDGIDFADIKGNYIGVEKTGLLDRGNTNHGIYCWQAEDFTLGGTTPGARNIISGNGQYGVYLNSNTPRPIIKGNIIGLGSDGNTAIGNGQRGIDIRNCDNAVIGGKTQHEKNFISSNGDDGLYLQNGDFIVIEGNFLGTDSTGLIARGNGGNGMEAWHCEDMTFGGTNKNSRNVVAANTITGVGLLGTSPRPIFKGNIVGLGADGTTAMGNGTRGIDIRNGDNGVIGGKTQHEKNFIGSNGDDGIYLASTDVFLIEGNYVGTDSTGMIARGNFITVEVNNCSDVTVGGTDKRSRNVLSASTGGRGFSAVGTCPRLIFKGNIVGLAVDGSTALGNFANGVHIQNADNSVIGGITQHEKNFIGSNGGLGIYIFNSDNCVVEGNYVGTDSTGSLDRGNGDTGIESRGCNDMVIGGTTAPERNIASNNDGNGILISGTSMRVTIKGNMIGLAIDGTTASGNSSSGISAYGCDDCVIGGSTQHEKNFIGDNNSRGIFSSDNDRLIIQGNYIGTDSTGLLDRSNGWRGIEMINSQVGNIGGSNAGEGNVVVGANNHGVSIWGGDSRNVTVQGNMIGVTVDGATAIGNGNYGIELFDSEDSQIGGTALAARNVISNSGSIGLYMANSPRTVVENNYIGVDGTGLIDMGNGSNGITVDNSADVVVGGTTRASRNIISGNVGEGVAFSGTSTGAEVKANFIGLGSDGATIIKNDNNGIWSGGSADGMTVGGTTDAERNVISGNGQWTVDADPDNGIIGDGIRILGTDNHVIQNNYIGTDSTGTIGLGNHWGGVSINDDSDNNDILDNIISDNRNEGIWIYNGSDNNEIYRNLIGVGSDGSALGNWDYGIYVHTGSSQSNTIGGSLANANTIAYTRGERPGLDGDGVTIGDGSNFNLITFNSIHCNMGEGIILAGTGNESVAAPAIVASNANDINGTGTNGMTVHIYRNVTVGTGCNCEGEIYLGTTTVAGGVWSFTHNLNLSTAEANSVSATQTTTNNSTSQFTNCSAPLPVTWFDIKAKTFESEYIVVDWMTISETNNSHFNIQLSSDGVKFSDFGRVEGAGFSTDLLSYSHVINEKPEKYKYLRLVSVDFDGSKHKSKVISLHNQQITPTISVIGNKIYLSNVEGKAEVSIISLEGKLIYQGNIVANKPIVIPDVTSSIYTVKCVFENNMIIKKVKLESY